MATDAEFEEKEYEIPLYMELVASASNIWPPGQVLEEHFGFDAAVLATGLGFWSRLGFPVPLEGVVMDHLNWGFIWRRVGHRRRLPTFGTNLMLQVKRPQFLRRRTRGLASKGLSNPYWRFPIREHQQQALARVASKLGHRALVAYACAAFHELSTLYQCIEHQGLVDNSTFVKAQRLHNHSYWAFDCPGTSGCCCSDPEDVSDKPFLDQVRVLAEMDAEVEPSQENILHALEDLAQNLLAVCKEEARHKNPRAVEALRLHPRIEDIRKEISVDSEREERAVRAFATVALFCNTFQLHWYVLG